MSAAESVSLIRPEDIYLPPRGAGGRCWRCIRAWIWISWARLIFWTTTSGARRRDRVFTRGPRCIFTARSPRSLRAQSARHGAGSRVCSPRPTRARWSGWRRCCGSTACRIGLAAARSTRSRRNRLRRDELISPAILATAGHCARCDRGRGFSFPDANSACSSARMTLSDEADVAARPVRREVEDCGVCFGLPRSGGRRLRGARGAWHRALSWG